MIVNADMLEYIKTIPSGSVNCVLTDPPYKQDAHRRGIAKNRKCYKEMAKFTNMDNDWYSEEILKEYVRVCEFPNIFLFCGKRDVYPCLKFAEENGYNYFILPLCKRTPVPLTNNTWLSSEFAVHITNKKLVYNKDYHLKLPYFLTGNEKETEHPNEKNIYDIKRIILNITREGDNVLDCFSGSGTVACACGELNRNFIAIEIDENYYKDSVIRYEEHIKQQKLF